MHKHLLIGESGGSKTDWVLLDNKGQTTKFSGESLHPKNWLDFNFKKLNKQFEMAGIAPRESRLVFYGAGCNSFEQQNAFILLVQELSFSNVEVHGDLLAACLATLGEEDGFASILGSGSVLIEYENKKVVRHFGGLGREIGDEGAGFYFGKLVSGAYQKDKLNSTQKSILESVLAKKKPISLKKGDFSEETCLELAFLLSEKTHEFMDFHRENFKLFFRKYVDLPKNTTIHFVGSYAYFHESILKQVCNAYGYHPGKIIARPMEALIAFYKKEILK
jgi:hypothetical protein